MDLEAVARSIKIDMVAVAASRALRAAGVPHILIKGPTTACWLYDPPRGYLDVDLLVPYDRHQDAVRALAAADVAHAFAGRLGEEASHSQVLSSPTGVEVDLHVTLPMLPTPSPEAGNALWSALSRHIVDFSLDGVPVPALDPAGRFLVVALHSVASAATSPQSREDFERARVRVSRADLDDAALLARELGADQLLALALHGSGWRGMKAQLPADVQLMLVGAPGGAVQLARLMSAPRRRWPLLAFREIFPSPGFMRHADPSLGESTARLLLAYARRARALVRALPAAVLAWRSVR